MAPMTEMYQGVEIRYGYSIQDDLFHAHFVLPPKNMVLRFQNNVSVSMSPTLSEGKHHLKASSDADLLKQARSAIGTYFED